MTGPYTWETPPDPFGAWRGSDQGDVLSPAVPQPQFAAIVGPVGPQGPQGALGPGASGFGGVDYTDNTTTPLALPAGQWVQVVRNLTPSTANFNLPRGPWAGFAFWDGALMRARALGDFYEFKFVYRATPSMRGAMIRFALRPGGNAAFDFGPSGIPLTTDAGVQDYGSITFLEQARTRFVTSGAQILAMISTGGTLDTFSPEIVPLGYQP